MTYPWIYVISVSLIGSKSGQSFNVYPPCLLNSDCLHLGVICYFFFDDDNQWNAMKPERPEQGINKGENGGEQQRK